MHSTYFKILFTFLFIGFVLACSKDESPTVGTTNRVDLKTNAIKSIGSDSAVCGGEIISDGGDFISERGVCWGTSSNPTVSPNSTTDGTGSGTFISIMRNLNPSSTYYVRAYVINAQGTLYGNQNSFKTLPAKPSLQTIVVSSITGNSATSGGSNINSQGSSITQKGICWSSTNANPSISDNSLSGGTGTANFTVSFSGLNQNTNYFVRAYATNVGGTGYGNVIQFKTLRIDLPTVTSTAISSITHTTANGGGNVTNDGGATVSQRGICWSTSSNPTILNSRTIDGSGLGSFSSQMTGLQSGTTYYVRAYATNSVGTAYGQQVTFSTQALQLPSLTSLSINSITPTTAIGGGNISNDGGAPVTQRGICWSTSTSPTTSNLRTLNGSGIGSFSSQMTGLESGRTYYVRAYATNSVGTAYGQQVTFTTQSLQLPSLTSLSINSITQTTAIGGGNISNDGGAPVTQRGICWSTSTNPTTSNSRTINGSGIGSFSSQMTGLQSGRTYYVRAYATNSVGTAYGQQVAFTTQSSFQLPSLTTSSVSSIAQTTATGGGNISNDGGSFVTQRGICWSTSNTAPTIANSRTVDGSGIGSFSSQMSGLLSARTYYVRAYATNAAGTGYGATVLFTTLSNLAVGQSYQGGIIGYIFVSGDAGYVAGQTHGLIVNPVNQSTGAPWGCSGTSIATTIAIGGGQTNTTAIVGNCTTTTIAARICNNLISGGYSDWFLPSREELNKLYQNRNIIGGFASSTYWSSSQSLSTSAWYISFSTGTIGTTAKVNLRYVRAVRRF